MKILRGNLPFALIAGFFSALMSCILTYDSLVVVGVPKIAGAEPYTSIEYFTGDSQVALLSINYQYSDTLMYTVCAVTTIILASVLYMVPLALRMIWLSLHKTKDNRSPFTRV